MRVSRVLLARVAVGMSGGVDSSVSALLLKRAGHEVVGVYMRSWDGQLAEESCSADRDLRDMREVCRALEIPSFELDLSKDYWLDVFEPLVQGYRSGRLTPNPDMDCNRLIKFEKFLALCFDRWRVDFVATGHYARLEDREDDKGRPYKALLRGVDKAKDQSYFLATTPVLLYMPLMEE